MTASPTPFAEGKATGSKMELVQPASADDPGRALWDKMQAEHDEQLSKHSMFQASPAMPSEEIVRLVASVMDRDNHALAVETTRKIEALFAPILAEKEREIEQSKATRDSYYRTIEMQAQENSAYLDHWQFAERRALAAEAALYWATKFMTPSVVAMDGDYQKHAPAIAAAIRAQGE